MERALLSLSSKDGDDTDEYPVVETGGSSVSQAIHGAFQNDAWISERGCSIDRMVEDDTVSMWP